jgi:ribonuclease HI
MAVKKVVIYTDGVSKGNPGVAAIGITIKDEKGKLITSISRRIGWATNNQAEYIAVITALEETVRLGVRQVELNSDSELVVRQINGRYRVKKEALKPLFQRVKKLQGSLESCTINHIPRQQNREADRLANAALNFISPYGDAEKFKLTIKLRQNTYENNDITTIYKIIKVLRDFPGQDAVSLALDSEEKVFSLDLSNIKVNYCPDLRKRLVEMVGKKRIKIESI